MLEYASGARRLLCKIGVSPSLQFLLDKEQDFLNDSGMESALNERGIGGIADFARVRCFHTWYAAHLVVPNSIGKLIDTLLNDETDLSAVISDLTTMLEKE